MLNPGWAMQVAKPIASRARAWWIRPGRGAISSVVAKSSASGSVARYRRSDDRGVGVAGMRDVSCVVSAIDPGQVGAAWHETVVSVRVRADAAGSWHEPPSKYSCPCVAENGNHERALVKAQLVVIRGR